MSATRKGTFSTDDLKLAGSLRLTGFTLADSVADADGRWTFTFTGLPDQLNSAVARYRLGSLSVNTRDLRANDRFVRRHLGPSRSTSARTSSARRPR